MRLKINGREIQIERSEGAPSPKEPGIFFIHGAGGDPSAWRIQADHFGSQRHVYRMALPGHDGSQGPGEREISAYAKWVRDVLEAMGPEKSHVIAGHSMGGAIVLELALDPPSQMRGAVVVGSGAKLAVLPDIFHMLENDPSAFFQFIIENAFAESTPEDIREPVVEAMRSCSASVILDDFIACDRFDIRHKLQEIQLPTLIVCGEEDRLTPVKYSEYLLEHIPDSRMRVISKAGHMVMAEQPGPLNQAIEKFIRGI
jgi:pimeloyl-ACP methyl ester carboxylesterase